MRTAKPGYKKVATISETYRRAKAEGIALSEEGLRRLIKEGKIYAAYVGNKALVSWDNVMAYINGPADKSIGA